MVISGAPLASGGLVCLALAAQIFETRRARLAIERGLAQLAAQLRESPVSRPAPPPSPPLLPPAGNRSPGGRRTPPRLRPYALCRARRPALLRSRARCSARRNL